MKKSILSSFLFATIIILNACSVNPVTGKKQVVFMSTEQEIAMGKEADPQIVAEYGLYENAALQSFITDKGKQMAAISHRPEINYEFKVVDSEILNAFAVPGGYVYFTRGIMAHFNNEAEFAGVLGHEIGHITARHTVAQQRNSILGQLGLIGAMVVAPDLAQFGEQASQGLGLLLLKFGRDAERESDRLGVEYSSKIGYDAQQMAGFFNTLERSRPSGSEELPDFLSSHPNPGDRNTAVAALATEWKTKLNLTNAKINRNTYLQKIEGLIYGEDPKQGFVENNVFYHPELKFQFNIPTNWGFKNSPQMVQMVPKDGKAIMNMTLLPGKSLQEAASNMLQQNGLQAIENREITVNGLRAISIIADVAPQQNQQQQQQQPIRTLSYIIQYGAAYYHIMGITHTNDFNTYVSSFQNTMQSFKTLTDAAKLAKKPERIRIKTVATSATLDQILRGYKMEPKRLEELAVLNGMKLSDRVEKGTMIKTIAF